MAVPALYDGYVRRPELVSRLRQAGDYPLVLIRAPAGYAKTSVLAEWAEQDDRPFAWVSLTSRDDDATRLLNRLVEAVDGVSLKGRPFVLVVDNADVVRSQGASDALANVIASLRPDGQIVLASRTEPRLPLGRMRAQREVFELTRRDLAMSRLESAALLEELGLKLSPEEADALHEQIEGWPAALYLAGLSLAQEPDTASGVAGFAGDDQFVSDYVRDEFLSGISLARLRFLIRSSILEDLEGNICDQVLERSGSARVLRELSRSNLPLDSLDHADGSYRYHPLFSQMLRAELHRREPDLERPLHGRASAWYAGRERFEEAIDHAIEAGDEKRAAELIWARAAPSLARGDRGAVRHWLDRFSDQKVAGSVRLALTAAHLYLTLGEGGLGAHWASVADEDFDEEADDDSELLADVLILRATLQRDGIENMGRDATRAADLLPPENPWRSISYFYAGASRYLSGNLESGKELLEEGARRGAANAPIAQVFCLVQLTLLHLDRDDLERALRVIAQAREQLERFNLGDYPVMATFFAASSLDPRARGADRGGGGRWQARREDAQRSGRLPGLVGRGGRDLPCPRVHAARRPSRSRKTACLRRGNRRPDPGCAKPSPLALRVAVVGIGDVRRSRSRWADARGVENASVSPEPPLVQRDRRAQLRFAEHGEDPGAGDLQETRCLLPR